MSCIYLYLYKKKIKMRKKIFFYLFCNNKEIHYSFVLYKTSLTKEKIS